MQKHDSGSYKESFAKLYQSYQIEKVNLNWKIEKY
jgi:hypothetical protein